LVFFCEHKKDRVIILYIFERRIESGKKVPVEEAQSKDKPSDKVRANYIL